MKLEHLKAFIAVYRAGGFAPVAAELNVDPSTVSRAIAGLETHLNARLFNRTTRALSPTEAGEAFFRRVEPLADELDAALEDIFELDQTPAGRLRVTASVSFGQLYLAPRLAAFRQAFPNIKVELVLSDRQIDLVEERIDIAIRHGELADSTMIARKLFDVDYKLVACPTYLEERGYPSRPEDLRNHDLITFPYKSFRESWQFEQGNRCETIEIDPALTVTNAAALLSCVEVGLGIALLADWTVQAALNQGAVKPLLSDWRVTGTSSSHAVSLIYPSQRFVPPKTRAFSEFLVSRR